MDKRQKYSAASTWYGPELAARDDWIHHFSLAEIDELVAAADANATQDIVSMRAEAFDLPRVDPVLARIRADVLAGRGFAILRGLPVQVWPMARIARVYWAIATRLGRPIGQNAIGNLLGHVIDVGGNAQNPHQRAHQSKGALPFHTDISAEVVGLFCLRGARSGGASALASVSALWNELIATRADLAQILTGPFNFDRRGDEVEGQDPWFSMPILVLGESGVLACHNPRFVRSAQRLAQLPPLTAVQEEALDVLQALADDPRIKLEIDFHAGDIQLINNLALLHSRGDYQDWQDLERRRHLLRLWLSVPGGQPIPETFYARHGADPDTGRPRGFPLPIGASHAAPLQPPGLRT